jgi:hypothetical protein
MSYMRFCVLDVGQGSANYIELREDDDSLTAAAIVDIGSEQWKTKAGRPSAEWVAGQLEGMTGGAVLDTMILSHSDSDHVNLIPALLGYFDTPSDAHPTKPVLAIKSVVFGGDFGKYKKGSSPNFLNQLTQYHPKNKDKDDILSELADDWTSFTDKPAKWEPLATIGGKISLWALSANTTAEKIPNDSKKRKRSQLPDGGFAINTRSIVIAAIFGNRTLIATGDATGLTLAHCNEALARKVVRDKLGAAYMVTLPHHGSDTTTYDLTGSQHGSDVAKQVVKDFSAWVNADTISGSAGQKRTFKHPSANVIADFGAHMLPDPQYIDPALKKTKEHFYNAYFSNRTLTVVGTGTAAPSAAEWPLSDWWYTCRTTKNLYTTDYSSLDSPNTAVRNAYPWEAREDGITNFTPEPPHGICWGFIIKADGTPRLEVVYERTDANAEYWAAVEAVHGPLPPSGWVVVPSAPLDDDASESLPEPPLPGPPPPGPPPPEPPPPEPPPPPPTRLRQLS